MKREIKAVLKGERWGSDSSKVRGGGGGNGYP